MISNFHQSSVPQNGSYNYTMAGFDNDRPPNSKSSKKKKKKRLFGLPGPKRKSKAANKLAMPRVNDDYTEGGHSLTYSSASSYQTTGESTDSSGIFGDILRVLDEEDRKELMMKKNKFSSNYSSTSSLAYSEGGTTLNYSEDGEQSYLEGTKLLHLQKENSPILGEFQDENKSFDLDTNIEFRFAPAHQPASKTSVHLLAEIKPKNSMEEEKEQESSFDTSSTAWLKSCGIDLPSPVQVNHARNALRPYLCFL
jgi:hypothetical protein